MKALMKQIYLLIFLMLINGCFNTNTQNLIRILHNPSQNIDNINVFSELHKKGKEAFPVLISSIDINKKIFVGFKNPRSSTIYPIYFNFAGIKSAYIIEFILSNKKNINVDADILEKSPYNIYTYSVIVKKNNDKPIMEALTLKDMKIIKELYLNWWSANKSKSLDQLREDWKNNRRPLENSNYDWE